MIEYVISWSDSTADFRITLEASKDAAASEIQAVPFALQRVSYPDLHAASQIIPATGYTTAVSPGAQLYMVLADPDRFPNDWAYCRLRVAKLGTGTVMGTVLVRFAEPRYAKESTPSVV